MMVFVNDCYKATSLYKPYLEGFVKMFSCICPFVGEEMWETLGHSGSLAYEPWPVFDESKLARKTVKIAASINGKMRDVLELSPDATQEEAIAAAMASEKIKPWIEGKNIKKVIFVKGRILNLVVA